MALTVLIADSTPRNVRGRIFSLINILGSLGSSTSVLLSGILYDLNQTLPFYIATIMYLLATLIAIKFLQEAKVRHI
jgi:MFS family permease